jgi:hypothetical protein
MERAIRRQFARMQPELRSVVDLVREVPDDIDEMKKGLDKYQ